MRQSKHDDDCGGGQINTDEILSPKRRAERTEPLSLVSNEWSCGVSGERNDSSNETSAGDERDRGISAGRKLCCTLLPRADNEHRK